MKEKNQYDVIVCGGGPAGMMAAISASSGKNRILLLEKNDKLGKKLIITGAGRCNVTNLSTVDNIIKNTPGNGRFLYSALANWDSQDIWNFFNTRGVKLKVEDEDRVFPKDDKSATILRCLVNEMEKKSIVIKTASKVKDVFHENGHVTGCILDSGVSFRCKKFILATGGQSYPQTGSTGDGYEIAKSVGHSITDNRPSEVPLTSNETFIKDGSLMGISIKETYFKILDNNGKLRSGQQGDVLFTHFGISGPCVLKASSFVIANKKGVLENPYLASIDCLPKFDEREIIKSFEKWAATDREKKNSQSLKNVLRSFMPVSLAKVILKRCNLDDNSRIRDINEKNKKALIDMIKNFPLRITGTLPIEQAFVTCGGINLKEINPKTMESKIIDGFYSCGEVLDLNGHTGGYNMTIAFVTGHLAGESAAKNL
ncbi:NAD(P)/FAD-dependent oxidoreductase [Eubacteriales bacterium KG125]